MTNRYLVPLSEQGDGPPIFIVPSAGATFFSFVTLGHTLSSSGPLYSFSLTELEVSPSTHPTLESIADVLLQELRTVQPEGPYYLGGHCWGGIVALHMASQLEALGEEVKCLFLMESFVPIAAGESRTTDTASSTKLQATMRTILETTLQDAREKLARMPKKHADRIVELTANQIQTASVYAPATIKAPIRLFQTDTHDQLAFTGWESLSSGGYSIRAVSGNTHSMLEKPHVTTLCNEIEAFLKSSK